MLQTGPSCQRTSGAKEIRSFQFSLSKKEHSSFSRPLGKNLSCAPPTHLFRPSHARFHSTVARLFAQRASSACLAHVHGHPSLLTSWTPGSLLQPASRFSPFCPPLRPLASSCVWPTPAVALVEVRTLVVTPGWSSAVLRPLLLREIWTAWSPTVPDGPRRRVTGVPVANGSHDWNAKTHPCSHCTARCLGACTSTARCCTSQ